MQTRHDRGQGHRMRSDEVQNICARMKRRRASGRAIELRYVLKLSLVTYYRPILINIDGSPCPP